MDILILVGFIVVILMFISPILAIIAITRANRAEYQLSQQNQRITSLEKVLSQQDKCAMDNQTELIQPEGESQFDLSQNQSSSSNTIDEYQDSIEPLIIDNKFIQATSAQQPKITPIVLDKNRFDSPSIPSDRPNINRFDNQYSSSIKADNAQNEGSWSIVSHFFSWIWTGNPLAKIGILLLFFGVVYPLKLSTRQKLEMMIGSL